MPKSVPKSIQTCFSVIFSKKIYAQCSMEGRVFENFQIFFSKFQKCPKLFHKRIQTCFELVLGQIFRNFFCPVFRGGSSFRKFSKKYFFKIPKMPKSVPKSIQTCFSVIFSKKNLCPVFHGGSSFRKFSIFFSKFQKGPKSFPKESKRVLNLFWVKFFENSFAQCSVEGRVFENFQKKNFKIPKMPKSVPKSLQTCFEHVFGANFSKNFCPVFHGMSSLRKFSKTYIFKITKMPKSVPKSIQTCFRVIFSKQFYARCSMEDRVFENFQNFFFQNSKTAQNCSKNVSKHVLNLFWVKFFEIFFCPVFRGGSSFRKFSKKYFFKIPKMPKSVPKSIQTCFSVIFSKKIYAQCSMEGRVFENFQIFFSKFQKGPKSFPKVSKRVLNLFWVTFVEFFFAQCSVEGRVFENFQKNIFSKFQKCPKVFSKVSKRVLNMFWGKFFEKFFCPVFLGGSSFRKFSTKKYFQNSKNAQKCSQKSPNMF